VKNVVAEVAIIQRPMNHFILAVYFKKVVKEKDAKAQCVIIPVRIYYIAPTSSRDNLF